MGMLHSSSLADLVFFGLVEEDLVFGRWGCLLYTRYRDDLFFVVQKAKFVRPFVSELERRAKPCWKLVVDRVSLVAASMLDIWFFKGSNFSSTGVLSHTAFVKPTARHIPLGYRSAHPESVHASWPVAEMRRLHDLNSSCSGSLVSRTRKIRRFEQFFMRADILSKVVSWRPNSVKKSPSRTRNSVIFRLVVRFHPCLRGLGFHLRGVLEQWQHRVSKIWGNLGEAPVFRMQVAYASACAPLCIVLRRGSF
jgi:hypothetical protein